MFSFLHTYVPDPIAFSFGVFTIHWYGLFASVGLISAWYVIERLQKKYKIKEDLFPLFLGCIIVGLIGARLYHVLNELPFYLENASLIPQVWKGGLALHGGIIGGLLYTWIWIKKHSLSLPLLLDIFATGGIMIQIFGRVGNYFNQELFGLPTTLPWGIPIVSPFRPELYKDVVYFHPTFIYELVLNSILFVILFTLHKRIVHGKIMLKKGSIFLIYLFFYSIIRASLEIIRIDQTPVILGIRLPIIVSVLIMIVSTILFFQKYAKKTSH